MTQPCWMVLVKRRTGPDIVKAYGNSDGSYIFFTEAEAVRMCRIANQGFDIPPYEVVEVGVQILDPRFDGEHWPPPLQEETFETVELSFPDEISAEEVFNALLLVDVGKEIQLDTVESWNHADRMLAYLWAMSAHLNASDNPDIEVLPKPDFLHYG